MNWRTLATAALVPVMALGACKDNNSEEAAIAVDGSSTVYPITEAVAEEFGIATGHRVNIGVSGTGGGFKKFCRGEIDVTGASRPVSAEEIEMCDEAGVDFIEVPIAYDGISVVVNPKNDFVDAMTVAELNKIWVPEAEGKILRWSQVRDGWPDKKIGLYGAGIASGTYDYFTQAIVGQEHSSRGDFTSSEDDNVLVQGVAGDPNALGFFGFAYYEQNKDRLKAIGIKVDAEAEAVLPTLKTINNATYQPLTRPLFVYVSAQAAEQKPPVAAFIDFFLNESTEYIEYTGFIPLPEQTYKKLSARFAARKTGSIFGSGGSKVGVSVMEMLDEADEAAPQQDEAASPGADGVAPAAAEAQPGGQDHAEDEASE